MFFCPQLAQSTVPGNINVFSLFETEVVSFQFQYNLGSNTKVNPVN